MDVEQYYDEKAPYYDGEYETPFFDLYFEITWDNIKRFLPPPKNTLILDAGGGTGKWAIHLAEQGYTVVLTDISRGMLRQARHNLEEKHIENVTVQRVDIQDMSCFPDETFDMVLVQGDPLSYCDDAERAVSELCRVVKPACYCIASVDSMYYLVRRLIQEKLWDLLDTVLEKRKATFRDRFAIRYYTPEDLSRLFEDAGFKTTRMIGKPVFLSMIPRETANNLLKDEKIFRKILRLELQYCDDSSMIGFAGHLEIVARKERLY